MRIFGIDFTSVPRLQKPITCAACTLSGQQLHVEAIQRWAEFEQFESLLIAEGRWLAAVDFPLGQPRRLVEALRWPTVWQDYVRLVGRMSKVEFVETIRAYCQRQPPGDKHHFRHTDTLASACSPMMVYGIPVAKMFFEGAPRVARSNVSVLPCRPRNTGRTMIEGYPALVARYLIGQQSYKGNGPNHSVREARRRRLVQASKGNRLADTYGITVAYARGLQRTMIEDTTGDSLDAVLCAIQAAWADRHQDLVFPPDVDSSEGWIADPALARI